MEIAPALLELVMKGGVTAVLCVIIGALSYEVLRLRTQATKIFAEREGFRLRYVLYKSACVNANIRVDESALQPIPEGS